MLDRVPVDLLLDSLLPLLPLRDLLSLGSTCHSLQTLIHSTQSIWRRRVEVEYRFPATATGRLDGFKTLYRKLSRPQVWVWGQARNSRLGLDPADGVLAQVLVGIDQVPTPLRIRGDGFRSLIDLQAGGWSFHGLDVDGKVWCWGTMDGGATNWNVQPNSLVYGSDEKRVKPALLTVEGLPAVRTISCGRRETLALADDGQLYQWASWKRIARLTSTPWNSLSQISAGWNLSGALTDSGEVYVWKDVSAIEVEEAFSGLRTQGEENVILLDIESSDRMVKTPDLPDRVIKIATGEDFIICLTEASKVYKLDLSIPNEIAETGTNPAFRPVMRASFLDGRRKWEYLPNFCDPDMLDEHLRSGLQDHTPDPGKRPKITHISAQYRSFVSYSVVAEGNGDSFVFMGKKESGSGDAPQVIPELQKRGVIHVSLGDYHFLALLANGQLLSWGSYSAGALGLGHPRRPHRRLIPNSLRSLPQATDHQQQETTTPTVLQSFSGTDGRWEVEGDGVVMSRRYVFAVTAAGWHSGCLAFGLDEDEDLDLGLDVIANVNEVDGERNTTNEAREARHTGLNPHGRFRFRIGYPGRFMRGQGRSVLDHHEHEHSQAYEGAHEEAEVGEGVD